MKIIGESLERPDRLFVAIRADGGHVNGGADIDRCGGWVNRGQIPPRTRSFGLRHSVDPPT